MLHPTFQRLLLCCLFSSVCLWKANAEIVPSFESDVQPIVAAHCSQCHSEKHQENGLNLEDRKSWIKGGKTGSAVIPGSLRESLVWSFIATDKMPAEGDKLSKAQKDVIRKWILFGAPASDIDAKQITASQSKQVIKLESNGVQATSTRIDQAISAKLQEKNIESAKKADDAEFLRRIYLDLVGRVPTYDETIQFLEENHKSKRDDLINQLLSSTEYGDHQAIIWHKLLIPKSAGAYPRIPHKKFRSWLSSEFNADRGWDEIVTELITAEGYLPSNKDNEITRKKAKKIQPQNVATAFINVHNTEGRPQPKGIIASVSKLFLAQSIDCAQCHNHPLAKWQQTDFWAAAAFFERVRYEKAVYGDTSIAKLIEPSEGKDLVYEDKAKGRYAFVKGVYSDPVIDLQDANGQRTGQMIRAKLLDDTTPNWTQNNLIEESLRNGLRLQTTRTLRRQW